MVITNLRLNHVLLTRTTLTDLYMHVLDSWLDRPTKEQLNMK